MTRTTRPLRGKKVLVARIGMGSLTLALSAAFPGCNLMIPECGKGTGSCFETDLRTPGACGDAGIGDAGAGDAGVCGDAGATDLAGKG